MSREKNCVKKLQLSFVWEDNRCGHEYTPTFSTLLWMSVCVFVCACVCLSLCACARMCVCARVCVGMHVRVCVSMRVCGPRTTSKSIPHPRTSDREAENQGLHPNIWLTFSKHVRLWVRPVQAVIMWRQLPKLLILRLARGHSTEPYDRLVYTPTLIELLHRREPLTDKLPHLNST